MRPGGAYSGAFVAATCLRIASLSHRERSLGLASTHGRSGIRGIALQMRRAFGPSGGAGKQDVLSPGDNGGDDPPPATGATFESMAAFRRAKRKSHDEPTRVAKKGPKRRKEGSNGINSGTGRRHRCFLRNSERYPLQRSPHRIWVSAGTFPALPCACVARRPPFPTISCEEEMYANSEVARMEMDGSPGAFFSVSTTPNECLPASGDDSSVVLDAGATANAACLR